MLSIYFVKHSQGTVQFVLLIKHYSRSQYFVSIRNTSNKLGQSLFWLALWKISLQTCSSSFTKGPFIHYLGTFLDFWTPLPTLFPPTSAYVIYEWYLKTRTQLPTSCLSLLWDILYLTKKKLRLRLWWNDLVK